MSRKGIKHKKRPRLDIRYTDHPTDVNRQIAKFINVVMLDGKKSIAERIVFSAFEIISERTKTTRSRCSRRRPPTSSRGSRFVPVASAVPTTRFRSRFDPSAARPSPTAGSSAVPAAVPKRPCESVSPTEMLDASQNRGMAVKKREDVHKMADANKAFAHYRW